MCWAVFQSSPAPQSRCDPHPMAKLPWESDQVSILTGSPEPVRPSMPGRGWCSWMFQSSPAPQSRCDEDGVPLLGGELVLVSILTGSPEPVRRAATSAPLPTPEFQSSPAPQSRCDAARPRARPADGVSILTGSPEPVRLMPFVIGPRSGSFNPHRLPRAGATARCGSSSRPPSSFNPHRLPRAGATRDRGGDAPPLGVSILTGSPEPVRLLCLAPCSRGCGFQSSPAPQSRCDLATSSGGVRLPPARRFQSSPAPQSRCDIFTLASWSVI